MSDEKKTDKPADPYQRYKDLKWQNPDQFKNGPIDDESESAVIVFAALFLYLFSFFVLL